MVSKPTFTAVSSRPRSVTGFFTGPDADKPLAHYLQILAEWAGWDKVPDAVKVDFNVRESAVEPGAHPVSEPGFRGFAALTRGFSGSISRPALDNSLGCYLDALAEEAGWEKPPEPLHLTLSLSG